MLHLRSLQRTGHLSHHVVSIDKKLYFTLSHPTQVYRWVLTTKYWGEGGGNLAMNQHPIQGREAILLVALCCKNWV